MALILKDRVQETSTTTGTGTLTLAGAVTQFQTFSSAVGNGNTTYYTIYNAGGSDWEVGIGTVGAGTLARTTVLASSNANALVNFTGTLYVFGDYPAGKAAYLDASGVINNTTFNATTSVITPIVQATNSGGLALKNSAGTTQISMGAGGGDNASINVSTNLNGTNAQIDISPTGTGHVHINPTGSGSIEINPTSLGTINNMSLGATTAAAAKVTTLNIQSGLTLATLPGTSGQVLTSAGTGAVPTWTTPATGTVTSVTGTAPVVSSGGNTPAISMPAATTSVSGYLTSTDWTTFNNKGSGSVTSVAATVPSFLSVSGSPITSSGTLAISLSGTALPAANGGTGLTSPGTSGNVLTSNGTGWVSSAPAGGITWQSVQTANFTAVAGNAYPINTTSGAVTITLPASPTAGQQLIFTDYAGNWATNNVIIANGTTPVNGGSGSGSTVKLATNRESVAFVYIDSTQGWITYQVSVTTVSSNLITISYLIVAGGGAVSNDATGGGGAGGRLAGTSTVTPGTVYSFVVGAGGTKGTTPTSGANSTGLGLTAIGGGYARDTVASASGGSGGGSGYAGTAGSGTTGQGNAGGNGSGAGPYTSGGGGGAGAVGADSTATNGGDGGIGLTSSITGSSVYYAGGGGGGAYNLGLGGAGGNGGGGTGGNFVGGVKTAGTNGTANTGGGGGGAPAGGGSSGGNGGSGIVIISVPTASYTGTTTGSPTVTTSGSNTILQYLSSGSYTA
jgi:hypothetical protein